MRDAPNLLVKDSLLLPLIITNIKLTDISEALEKEVTVDGVVVNGLFVMAVAYFESMVREILAYYLNCHPYKIPEKDKGITIKKEQLLNYEGFSFLKNLISDYVGILSFKELGDLFFKVLSIKKPLHVVLDSIVKIKDKRNELMHNNLTVDYKHRSYEEDRIEKEYLFSCLETFQKFIYEVEGEINNKYSEFTRLRLFKDLWKYTFTTSLCSDINDYWDIDEDNDCISAYKKPRQEKALSGSETFLLGIWRGQFTNYKIEFLNMSSLGEHAQFCMYLFLKVSNDIFMYR